MRSVNSRHEDPAFGGFCCKMCHQSWAAKKSYLAYLGFRRLMMMLNLTRQLEVLATGGSAAGPVRDWLSCQCSA